MELMIHGSCRFTFFTAPMTGRDWIPLPGGPYLTGSMETATTAMTVPDYIGRSLKGRLLGTVAALFVWHAARLSRDFIGMSVPLDALRYIPQTRYGFLGRVIRTSISIPTVTFAHRVRDTALCAFGQHSKRAIIEKKYPRRCWGILESRSSVHSGFSGKLA